MNKINQLNEWLKENPDDSFLIYALALEYIKNNQIQEAKKQFDELTQKHPKYLATYLQFGNLLAEMGNKEKAEDIYRKGLEIAIEQNNSKTYKEINQALNNMIDDV
ncbi:MAG: tetratricopeptide repeat protein [Bacteroidia bacterium]|nr:tetratricopeptide repeat protein [Bacteroidia bacterium]MCZ2249215.1 tetratricopeptide repeat protein [Bacteroidia bacterium]